MVDRVTLLDGVRVIDLAGEPAAMAGRVLADLGADVVVVEGHAYLFYFTHQGGEDAAKADDRWHQRSAIQAAELKLQDGWLSVDRDAPPPDLRAAFAAKKR